MELPELFVFILGREPNPSLSVDFLESLELIGINGSGIACKRHGIVKGFCDERALPQPVERMQCPFCARDEVGLRNDPLLIVAIDAAKAVLGGYGYEDHSKLTEDQWHRVITAALSPALTMLANERAAYAERIRQFESQVEQMKQALLTTPGQPNDEFAQAGFAVIPIEGNCECKLDDGTQCTEPAVRVLTLVTRVCMRHLEQEEFER